jgi:hypothetical protein
MKYSKAYQDLDDHESDGVYSENIDEIVESLEREAQKHGHKKARKSVDEYLEHKRLRRQYQYLFDDNFDDEN